MSKSLMIEKLATKIIKRTNTRLSSQKSKRKSKNRKAMILIVNSFFSSLPRWKLTSKKIQLGLNLKNCLLIAKLKVEKVK